MLKTARLIKNISQKDLAKKLGISKSYLSRIEKRDYQHDFNVNITLIFKLSKALDICPFMIINHLYGFCKECKINICLKKQ